MRHLLTAACVAIVLSGHAQQRNDSIPDVNLRLEMAADELEASAHRGDLAAYSMLIGGAMTAIAARTSERDALMIGTITVATCYTLTLNGNGRKRRAALRLRGH